MASCVPPIHARVSTERQERQQTIGSQLANLHRRADAEGHALAEAHDYGLRCAAA